MFLVDLAPRDDLKSLAYTLVFLLRGSLPRSHYAHHGTTLGRLRQVLEQKKAQSGAQLTKGCPPVVGELLDYARSLGYDDAPDYQKFRQLVKAFTTVTCRKRRDSCTRSGERLAHRHIGLHRRFAKQTTKSGRLSACSFVLG